MEKETMGAEPLRYKAVARVTIEGPEYTDLDYQNRPQTHRHTLYAVDFTGSSGELAEWLGAILEHVCTRPEVLQQEHRIEEGKGEGDA